ncbi:MAG TPA: SPOR domain-containing protein [Pusillimonas sp.]|uniref:SPOR domain-containing protein n=1 Tax=Pusillimonas sp. TaxID=3040095 RepID=UPI002BA4C815|nr:SPOR domain-containing protein [Pusillimonas sp.]HUH88237.1 SPOR domain-containing protein [Pusillimonas sp.]
MARRKSTSSKSGGSTLFGLLAGLIIGLAAAAAVAYFVTQVPMPFVDKASRDPANILLPDVRDAPDPNLGLYGKSGAAGSAANGPTATPPSPLPGATPGQAPGSMADEIGTLLETLGAPAPGTANKPAPAAQAESPRTPSPADIAATTQTTYYLQAGAFRSNKDAEAVKAQILLLGLPVQVQQAQLNGSPIHRVRVGPFKGIDEMNRSRVRLSEAKIESSVVRP